MPYLDAMIDNLETNLMLLREQIAERERLFRNMSGAVVRTAQSVPPDTITVRIFTIAITRMAS